MKKHWYIILIVSLISAPLISASLVWANDDQRGVSLAGLEFAPTILPGTEGTNYTKTFDADFAYFCQTKGFQLVRLPILWERIQPTVNGALDATYQGYIDTAITRAKSYGCKIILDVHNYGRRDISGVSQTIGGGTLTKEHLADLWTKLATLYVNEVGVYAYDIMNEPHDMPVPSTSSTYRTTATVTLMNQAVINAIRAVDTDKWIFIPSDRWGGIQSFATNYGTNPTKWWTDTSNKTMLTFHYYQDSDHSGSYTGSWSQTLRDNLPSDVAPALQWAEVNSIPVFMGEYGVPNGSSPSNLNWQTDLGSLMTIFDNHQVIGTHWGAGQWYTSTTTLQPTVSYTVDREQLPHLTSHLSFSTTTTVRTYENFERYADSATTTDDSTYEFASFPYDGKGGTNDPSATWETGSGGLYTDEDSTGNMWGFSGKPTTWGDRYHARINTVSSSTLDQIVEFRYKSAPFGEDGYLPVASGEATDIWLRFVSQYWLYALQFDRVNDKIVLKRKVPTNSNGTWGGDSSQISNKGIYYNVFTDSEQPVVGAGFQNGITWTQLSTSSLAHDGTSTGGTTYNFKATITTPSTNTVQVKLYRGGVLVGSWTDTNNAMASNGRTAQQDCDAGYFTTVTGYKAAWCQPIINVGKSGIRGDNIKFWFDDFKLSEAQELPSPATSTAPTALDAVAGISQNTISWTTPTDDGGAEITGYKLYRNTSSPATTLYQSLGLVNNYTDTSVSYGTTYYYRVIATNSVGDSSYSNQDSASPTAPTPSIISGSLNVQGGVTFSGNITFKPQ